MEMVSVNLFAFGSNGLGQLGVGHQNDVNLPQLCRFTEKVNSLPVRLAASGNSTMILFESGSIYCAGANPPRKGQQQQNVHQFEPIVSFETFKVKLCSATWDASMIVTDTDDIFVCGRGGKGELGLGIGSMVAETDTKLKNFPPDGLSIVDIASSVSHSVVVLSNGEVYGWGNGRKGQLGEPSLTVWQPRKFEEVGFEVVRAVCGREFTFLLGDPKSRKFKIVGSDKWGIRSLAPVLEQTPHDIGANWGSMVVQLTDGTIQAWGRKDRGQDAPSNLVQIRYMAMGSEHGLAVIPDGTILCWGWGEHGNCGPNIDFNGNTSGKTVQLPIPEELQKMQILGVGAGCATSFLWALAQSSPG